MPLWSRFLFPVLMAVSFTARAEIWVADEMLNDVAIESATREACSKIRSGDLYGGLAFDELYAGKFPSANFNRLIGHIFREEFKKNTIYLLSDDSSNQNELWLLDSQGFNRALNSCFTSEKDRDRFKKLVSNRKRAGQTAGFVASAVALSGVSSGLQKLSAGLYRLWIWAGVSVVGYEAYGQTRELLNDIKTKREITKVCGETPKVDCIMQVLAKAQK